MIDFELSGEIQGVTASRESPGFNYVRVFPFGHYRFPKQGETPGYVLVKATVAQSSNLTVGAKVKISGKMAVGSHEWERPAKFGEKPKTKDILNYYFDAEQINVDGPKVK
jgi:hypothetical protein